MPIPEKIPIMRMEDYHTHYLGKTSNKKLFWGYETFVFLKPPMEISTIEELRKHKLEYAILHTFDIEGNYLETKSFSSFDEKTISKKVEEMVSALGKVKYCDIKIKLCQTVIDNIIFGLIPYTDDYERVDLEPSSTISFTEPWDGEYDT